MFAKDKTGKPYLVSTAIEQGDIATIAVRLPKSLWLKIQLALSSEYKCMFGISAAVPGLEAGIDYRIIGEHWSSLIIAGKNSRCFWFAFKKMDQKYSLPNIPRFKEEDQDAFVKLWRKRSINGQVTFGDIWGRKITSVLLPLEEGQYEHWALDRFACLGDSIHKMTPNA